MPPTSRAHRGYGTTPRAAGSSGYPAVHRRGAAAGTRWCRAGRSRGSRPSGGSCARRRRRSRGRRGGTRGRKGRRTDIRRRLCTAPRCAPWRSAHRAAHRLRRAPRPRPTGAGRRRRRDPGADDPDAQPLLVAERLQRRLVGGARRHGHQLAGQLSVAADRRALLHRQLGAGDEDHRREGHLLLPQPVVGGRAAFEVDVAAAQQGEAVLRGDRLVADLDWPDAQFGGRPRDDLLAEVDRVADRAAAWIEEGEGDRTLPDPQRDRPAVPDLLQRAGQLVGREAPGREDRQHAGEDDETEPHDTLPQAGSARTSAKSSAALCSSPSHLLTAAVASELPSTLVAERPMSRNWSMPMISSRPASGMLNWFSVAAMTTSEARGTPAMPLLVSISTSSMVISWARESSIL